MRRAKRLQNVHPGEVLVEEFLKPLGVTQYELAKRVRVPMTRIAEISRQRRAIAADTALRLARFFGTTSKFWLGLQEDYDLEEVLRARRRPFFGAYPKLVLFAADRFVPSFSGRNEPFIGRRTACTFGGKGQGL